MVFKKLDRALAAAQSSLAALITRRLTTNLSACNQERMCAGSGWKWHLQNPVLLGSVGERYVPLKLPISPEASALKFRLRYECLYASVNVRFSAILGPGESTEPTAWDELTTTGGSRATSDWYTLSVIEAQRRGMTEVPVAFRLESEASATTGSSSASFANPEMVTLSTDLTGTFNNEDVLKITMRGLSGAPTPYDWFDEERSQSIRLEADRFYIWPFLGPRDARSFAQSVVLTRMGQLKLYGIEWMEVHGTPYEAADRERFPWQDDDRHYKPMSPGFGAGARSLRSLYDAGEYLQAKRTPVYSVFPALAGDISTNWMSYNTDSILAFPVTPIKSSYAWFTLCQVPLPDGETFTGDASITTRKALSVSYDFFATCETQQDWPWEFRLITVDASGTTVTTGTAIRQTLTSLSNQDGYIPFIYQFKRLDGSGASALVESSEKISRNNLQGLLDMDLLGREGFQTIRLDLNDDDVSGPGKYIRVQVRPYGSAPGARWRFFTTGCTVRPPQTRLWGEVGT